MIDTAKRKAMLKQIFLVHAFEEKFDELCQRKAMFGSTQSSRPRGDRGGSCSTLESTDSIASYHRGTAI